MILQSEEGRKKTSRNELPPRTTADDEMSGEQLDDRMQHKTEDNQRKRQNKDISPSHGQPKKQTAAENGMYKPTNKTTDNEELPAINRRQIP